MNKCRRTHLKPTRSNIKLSRKSIKNANIHPHRNVFSDRSNISQKYNRRRGLCTESGSITGLSTRYQLCFNHESSDKGPNHIRISDKCDCVILYPLSQPRYNKPSKRSGSSHSPRYHIPSQHCGQYRPSLFNMSVYKCIAKTRVLSRDIAKPRRRHIGYLANIR